MQEYTDCPSWPKVSIQDRCRIVASAAGIIAKDRGRWVELCSSPQRVDALETVTAELFPLCSALRFIGRTGPKLLKTRRLGWWNRPAWLWGVRSEIRRDPYGRVLVLGTWNYPLFLVGAQAAQALAGGNQVWIKPAPGCEAISQQLAQTFHQCGVPSQALRVLESSTEAANDAIDAGVDLIVLTGAASTGRKVLRRAAESLTPTIMELSGCDAVIVLPGANLDRTAQAVAFALTLNSGATCIGPRRIMIADDSADALIEALRDRLAASAPFRIHPAARSVVAEAIQGALASGADDLLRHFNQQRLLDQGTLAPVVLDRVEPEAPIASADLFAPVLSIIRLRDVTDAIGIVNAGPYRLAASVFGPRREAERLASHLSVGSIAINDLVVPTADPRVPFGGRGESGFGVTRGSEGLLAMTVPVVTGIRRGRWMPHLMIRRASDAQTLLGALQLLHGSTLANRWAGLKQILVANRSRDSRQAPIGGNVSSDPNPSESRSTESP